jgi:peptidylprolyl isomerase
MRTDPGVSALSRRAFLTTTVSATVASTGWATNHRPANAAPEIFTTASGIKYAVLQPPTKNPSSLKGDIVAIEYTGYLSNGAIFDGTHGEGKKNILVFELGGNAVIDGINEMVSSMGVGEKRQVIIPPQLAFGNKGICVGDDDKECLVKPNSTLVYDISLKRSAIPPP